MKENPNKAQSFLFALYQQINEGTDRKSTEEFESGQKCQLDEPAGGVQNTVEKTQENK